MSFPSIFSGSSRYANDFTQIIERSLAIASLPMTQLGAEQARLNDESTALSSLTSKISGLRSAINRIQDATGLSSYAAATSDGAVVSPSLTGAVLPGTYTIEVVQSGARATTACKETLLKVTNPAQSNISNASIFTLTVGTGSYEIIPSAGTLDALASAINDTAPAGVQAVIVNVGSASVPDYKLSIQSQKLGAIAIQLSDGSEDLLESTSPGSPAQYRINGQPAGTPISSDAAMGVVIAPGLNIDLLKAGTSTITISRSGTALSAALTAFAESYNGIIAELDKHRGEGAGALAGKSIISEVTRSVRRLTSYRGSESASSLTDLGFAFNDKGLLSFATSSLTASLSTGVSATLDFLGFADGSGFLAEADRILDSLDASSGGLMQVATDSVRRQISSTNELMSSNQERLDLLRGSLAARMSAADALIASMEQQVRYMTGLLEATRINAESLR